MISNRVVSKVCTLFSLYYIYYLIIYLLQYIYLLPYYLSINQYFTWVVSYYFSTIFSLPYYFFCLNTPVQHDFCTDFVLKLSKNRKNSHIFCNFFSLCINDLEES